MFDILFPAAVVKCRRRIKQYQSDAENRATDDMTGLPVKTGEKDQKYQSGDTDQGSCSMSNTIENFFQ
jgi:hypothetical protein